MTNESSPITADDVRQALAWFVTRAGYGDVDVVVSSGTATLRGTVDSPTSRRALEDLALAHDGVEQVVNELEVAPAGVAGRPLG